MLKLPLFIFKTIVYYIGVFIGTIASIVGFVCMYIADFAFWLMQYGSNFGD
jgi:hypothetical protein